MKRPSRPPLLALLLVLSGCSTPVERPAVAPASPVTEPRFIVLDGPPSRPLLPEQSRIELRVGREGALARLGHAHVVVTQSVTGRVWRVTHRPDLTRLDASFAVDSLVVDDPAARAAAGPGYAAAVDAEAIAGTRRNMLSPALLDGGAFPTIKLRVDGLAPAPAAACGTGCTAWLATVVFTIKDQQRAVTVPVQLVEGPDGHATARGELTLNHADLGLTPFSAMGGLLRVAEAIEVRFSLAI